MTTEIQKIESKLSWLITPAHLVLSGLLVLALLGGVYLFESKRADVSDAKAAAQAQITAIAEKAAVDSDAKNLILQIQNKQTQDTLSAANAQLAASNAQLQAANRQLSTSLATQRKIDATLAPTDQAARWQKIVPQATVAITSTGFALDSNSGLATLQALEELPVDRQTIINDNSTMANDLTTHQNDVVALTSEKAAHASDLDADTKKLTASKAETKKVQDDFDAYKTHVHKNYIKIAVAFFTLGWLGGKFVHPTVN